MKYRPSPKCGPNNPSVCKLFFLVLFLVQVITALFSLWRYYVVHTCPSFVKKRKVLTHVLLEFFKNIYFSYNFDTLSIFSCTRGCVHELI